MRNRGMLLVLLAAILGALAWSIWPANEPRYQGARVSFWIELPGYDSTSLAYFPKLDTNAIPYLVKALNRKSGPLQTICSSPTYSNTYPHLPIWVRRRLHVPSKFTDWMVRASAAQLLGRIGTNSPPAISGLLRVLKREKNGVVKIYAVESLQQIGRGNETVNQAMIEALKDPEPGVRDAAGDALRQLDPAAAKTLIK